MYIDKCVSENQLNDIDPHHYKMEWNHFLPKCVFGDWPIGHYLTVKQHAIASAIQTLAFETNCMCGWHKKYIPVELLELAWPYYKKQYSKNKEKMSRAAHREKDEKGKSLLGIKNAKRMHVNRDETGKSIVAKKAGLTMNAIKHKDKDEHGRSIAAKSSHFAKKSRPIKVTSLNTGEVWEFSNSVDAGLALGLSARLLRRVASGERKHHKNYLAEYTPLVCLL